MFSRARRRPISGAWPKRSWLGCNGASIGTPPRAGTNSGWMRHWPAVRRNRLSGINIMPRWNGALNGPKEKAADAPGYPAALLSGRRGGDRKTGAAGWSQYSRALGRGSAAHDQAVVGASPSGTQTYGPETTNNSILAGARLSEVADFLSGRGGQPAVVACALRRHGPSGARNGKLKHPPGP